MLFWVVQTSLLLAALVLQEYVRRRARRSLNAESQQVLGRRITAYYTTRGYLMLGLLLGILVLVQLFPQEKPLLLQIGVLTCLALGAGVVQWQYDRLAALPWAAGMLEAFLFAEMLLYVCLAGGISLPLLALRLAPPAYALLP
ncbi:MAG: hypothetical protein KF690_04835 [Bacteroidetes bacterium]|nr:hypothetical protein [Bacteroidota bacterium]